jgi:twitching motility protein PilT
VRSKQWANPAERDDLLKRLVSLSGVPVDDVTALYLDTDPAIRAVGVELLKKLPPQQASAAVLAGIARQSEASRKKSFETYVALQGGDLSMEKLADLCSDKRPQVAGEALDWIRGRAKPAYLPLVELPLSSGSPSLRRRAISVVEAIGTAQAIPFAARVIEDDDEEVRFHAVSVLAKTPSDKTLSLFLKAAADVSPRIQQLASQGLKPLLANTSSLWQTEVMPLLSDPNPRVREFASRIIRDQDATRVMEAFVSSFKNVFGPERDRAISSLRGMGDKFQEALVSRADDKDPDAAKLAASIAVSLRSPIIVNLCMRLLKGQDWWLRYRAAEALAEIRDERALSGLIELLNDRETDLTAAAALGAWGTPAALPALLEAYKKGQKDLRMEILEAFSKIRDPKVPPLLEKIIQVDPDAMVREKGRAALAKLQGRQTEGDEHDTPTQFSRVELTAAKQLSLHDLLQHARAVEASDVHLAVNAVPHLRIHGVMTPLPVPPLSDETTQRMILPILTNEQKSRLERDRHLDLCHKDAELGRFRTNVFYQRKGLDAVFRLIPPDVPALEDIGVPESLWEIANYSQGLVLVTGPSGCGKTTTLAAYVDKINRHQSSHVLTIEDPIEYLHRSRHALVNQRQVTTHSESFAKALQQSLREDPDVIMVGELRDLETIALALTASETGHLVFGTLHTSTASGTIDRIVDAFPAGQQAQIRQMLADSLIAVISQVLLPRRDGKGRVAAYEVLRNTPNVAGLIREAKTHQIPSAIQMGAAAGMQTMDAAMLKLVQDGAVDPRDAYDRAQRKEAFEPLLEEGAA